MENRTMMTKSEIEELPLSVHLKELQRVVWVFLLSIGGGVLVMFFFSTPILQWIASLTQQQELVLLSPLEGFLARCKIAFWGSLLFSSPLWMGTFFSFLTPALFPHEKKMISSIALASIIILCITITLFFSYTFPWMNTYLTTWNEAIGSNIWSLSHYIDYLFLLLMGHVLLGQFIVILYSLVLTKVLSTKKLVQYRKPFILATFIVSAFVTPPDVLTQCLLAFPTLLLYEGAILLGKPLGHSLLVEETLIS